MLVWKRALPLAFLSWMIPFAVSLSIFPVKQANDPLFQTLMSLAVLGTAAILLMAYFRSRAVSLGEALALGALCFAFNVALDYPMFAYGPMKMTAGQYYSSIGLDYLAFPVMAIAAATIARGGTPRPQPH